MSEYFIARQPIFTKEMDLYAYELLFRESLENFAPLDLDENAATAEVLTTSSDVGLSGLVGEHKAFINLPQRFFEEPDLLPLPPDQLVLEVLESVEINEATIKGIKTLRDRGFSLALDDVVDLESYEATLPHVDIVKLEIPDIPPDSWEPVVGALKRRGFKVLAEKVETNEEFERLAELGCDLFQGYFFAKPKIVSGRKLSANKLVLLELMSKINDPNTDIEALSDLISRDVALSVRVLNYVNSAANVLNRRVESIRDGVVYLGRDTIRNLVTVFTMGNVEERPTELLVMALRRGRFCELLAQHNEQEDSPAFFTVGMFSVLDALMNAPMTEVVNKLTITADMRLALETHGGEKGQLLSLAVALERADYEYLDENSVDADVVAKLHQDALSWADSVIQSSGIS
ncbi:MAG: HDOD domain-containing protein [Pseudomonadota bacterium]